MTTKEKLMGDYGIFRMWEEDARTVYSHLQDEESRKLFDLKNIG